MWKRALVLFCLVLAAGFGTGPASACMCGCPIGNEKPTVEEILREADLAMVGTVTEVTAIEDDAPTEPGGYMMRWRVVKLKPAEIIKGNELVSQSVWMPAYLMCGPALNLGDTFKVVASMRDGRLEADDFHCGCKAETVFPEGRHTWMVLLGSLAALFAMTIGAFIVRRWTAKPRDI